MSEPEEKKEVQVPIPSSPPDMSQFDPELDLLEKRVIQVIKSCYDPEIPVNIYELGLIYGIDVTKDGHVEIKMTLTSPACPVAGSLPPEVEGKLKEVEGVTDVKVTLVWEPPWKIEMMTEAARLQLGMM